MKYALPALAALTITAPLSFGQPSATPRPPNVILIMSDDLNNALGAYGHPIVKSPNIDALAARGVRFDRAYCQFPLCNPSRASMLTGRRPDAIKVLDLETHFRHTTPDVVTLPEQFRRHGYRVMRIGKIFHYGVPHDIGSPGADDPVSWDKAINPYGRDTLHPETVINFTPHVPIGGALSYREDDGPDEEQTDGWIATESIKQLEQLKSAGRPFFLGIGFFRPHVPYIAPKKYFDQYPLDTIPAPADPTESLKAVPVAAYAKPLFQGLTPRQQRLIIRAYYASVSFMDAQVGRVLAALDRLGLAENTIIVFTSDHGYLLGEHGQWLKQRLFEESVRSPLIIAAPGYSRGGLVPGPVEFLDIYPTLAELARLPAPPALQGRSLVPLLRQPDTAWPHPAFAQLPQGTSIRTDRWAYNEWGPDGVDGAELYDHGADPLEHHNLATDPAYAPVIKDLKTQLHAVLPPRPALPRSPRPAWFPKISPGYIPEGDR